MVQQTFYQRVTGKKIKQVLQRDWWLLIITLWVIAVGVWYPFLKDMITFVTT